MLVWQLQSHLMAALIETLILAIKRVVHSMLVEVEVPLWLADVVDTQAWRAFEELDTGKLEAQNLFHPN